MHVRARALEQTHHRMRPRAEFPAPGKERGFGRESECLARALRGHRALRRQ